MKLFLQVIIALTFCFAVNSQADDGKIKPVGSKNYVATNLHAKEYFKKLADVKVESIEFKGVNPDKAFKILFDAVSEGKANYSNLVVIADESKEITMSLSNVSFVECIDKICDVTEVSWTIWFYDSNKDYSMIGVGTIEVMKKFGFRKVK